MDTAVRPVEAHAPEASSALLVRFPAALGLTDDGLYELCRINRDLRIERTAGGDLSIMTPAGGESSNRNAEITFQLRRWAKRDGTGTTFDSSGGFRLPNGAVRSPDAAWISHARLAALTDEQRERFVPLCPDFVVELRSPSDDPAPLHDKMREYLENGARLGWLIDPPGRQVFVYRPDSRRARLAAPARVSADPVLPGFSLETDEIL